MKPELVEQINRLPLFEKRRVYLRDRFSEGYIEQEDFRAIVETGSDRALAVVTRDYALVQLREGFRKIVEKLPENIAGRVDHYRGRACMTVYPEGEDIGLYAVNSVDGSSALRVDFVVRGDFGRIFIPRRVAGLRRIHRGRIETEFENFLDVIARVKSAWFSIVQTLSQRAAREEDIKTFSDLLGKRGARELETWLAGHPQPTVWELVKQAVRIISGRRYKTELHRSERLRRVSFAILAYALKE